jgi:PPM family protein phosphatase
LNSKLFLQQDMPRAELFELAGGVAAIFSTRCPGKTTANEDAAALIELDERSGVLVLADGLGGVRNGDEASSQAVAALIASVRHGAKNEDLLRTAILNGFERANREVQTLRAATTLAVVEIHDGHVRPYHVGDSVILVTGQRGRVKLQTVAHSPVGYAVEAGLLDEIEAMHHDERHLVSNVIGTPDMRIEIGSMLRLAARDTVVLASDGLVDNLDRQEIIDRVAVGPLDTAVDRLAAESLARMADPGSGAPSKPDDLTIVAFRRQRT